MWWVINKSGNVIGPFSSEQLERQIKLNMIHSLDRISKDKKEWFYVKDSAFWYPARTMKTHGLSSSLPKIDHKDVDNVVVDSSIEDNAQVSETQNRGDCNTSSEHHINLNTNVIQDKRFWVALILIVVIALFGFGVITFLLVKNSTLQNEVNSIEDKGDRKEKSESSPELVGFNKIKDKLVIIECDEGFGSGFLLSMNGKTYLMTNEHVVRCTKTPNARLLDGTPLKLGSFSIATDRDLARFEVIECSVNPFQMNDILPNTGDMVAVYGNSLGRGVVTESKGFIQGVGPNRLETNCEIVPGNSGSPLVAADGRILGVAAFVDRRGSDEWTVKNTRYEGTPRRFAVRFTGVAWKNIDRTRYEQQIANLKEFETYWEYLLPYLCFDSTQVEEEQLIFNDMKSKNFKLKENAYVEMLKELTKIFEKREKVYNQFSDHLNARDIFIQRLVDNGVSEEDEVRAISEYDQKTADLFEKVKKLIREIIFLRKEALEIAQETLDRGPWDVPQVMNGYSSDNRKGSIEWYKEGVTFFMDLMNQKLKDFDKEVDMIERGEENDE